MALPWLRLYTEYATDPKIQILAFDDQRHFVMLLCLKGNGTLDCVAPNDAYRERLVAKALGLDPASASEVKRRLVEGGLIADDWNPSAWSHRQCASDHDGAERQRRYRESKKRDSDGDVTTVSCDSDAIDKIRLDKTRQDKNQDMSRGTATLVGKGEVEKVFEHWKTTWNHPHAKLDRKRDTTIRAALKLYPADTLCLAVSGYQNSPHHCGRNERNTVYDDIGLLLRDAQHIDAGLRFGVTPPKENGKWT